MVRVTKASREKRMTREVDYRPIMEGKKRSPFLRYLHRSDEKVKEYGMYDKHKEGSLSWLGYKKQTVIKNRR